MKRLDRTGSPPGVRPAAGCVRARRRTRGRRYEHPAPAWPAIGRRESRCTGSFTRSGGRTADWVEDRVTYSRPDGEVFATKWVDYRTNPVAPDFELIDSATGHREGAAARRGYAGGAISLVGRRARALRDASGRHRIDRRRRLRPIHRAEVGPARGRSCGGPAVSDPESTGHRRHAGPAPAPRRRRRQSRTRVRAGDQFGAGAARRARDTRVLRPPRLAGCFATRAPRTFATPTAGTWT